MLPVSCSLCSLFDSLFCFLFSARSAPCLALCRASCFLFALLPVWLSVVLPVSRLTLLFPVFSLPYRTTVPLFRLEVMGMASTHFQWKSLSPLLSDPNPLRYGGGLTMTLEHYHCNAVWDSNLRLLSLSSNGSIHSFCLVLSLSIFLFFPSPSTHILSLSNALSLSLNHSHPLRNVRPCISLRDHYLGLHDV